jgi:3-oxo-5alpha-steroid 4-dehydrogenase
MSDSLRLPSTAPFRAEVLRPDGVLPVQTPLSISNADALDWAERCDVLVIGLGAAGAASAISAAESGARVIATDRFQGGGATTKSGGVVYAGGGTRQQKALGYDDTPEAMFRYLRAETGDAISEATLRRFCEDSRGLIEWLETIGADFTSTVPPPKTSYPRDGVYLYYSGNEAVPEYAAQAAPAPRGHRTRGSWMSGRVLYELLRARIEALGIPVLAQTAARRLVTDVQGAVLGAELWQLPAGSPAAQRHHKLMQRAENVHNFAPAWADRLRAQALDLEMREAQPRLVRATGGVVLSTGGFIFNREMLLRHAPAYRSTLRLGSTGCDGSGIRMGQSVGGSAARMEKVSAWRFINPPTAWPRGVVVGPSGQRFCNEQVYGAKLGVQMCEQQSGRAWLILDKRLRRAAMREALFGGLWFFQSVPAFFLMLFAPRSRSLETLAKRIGVPGKVLRASVEQYSADARQQRADALGKSAEMRQPLDAPPYYALDISAGSKSFPCPAITLGGLRVDEASGQVLHESGGAIPGLYAAGRCAVGIASNGYVSGLSLADCLWSGRRAGRHSATSVRSPIQQEV